MSWPPWRRTGERNVWFEEHPLWYPVCYQLALGPSSLTSEDDAEVVYVGVAPHEKAVFDALEGETAPYSAALREALDAGEVLWYRAQARPTLEEASELCDEVVGEMGRPPRWNEEGTGNEP